MEYQKSKLEKLEEKQKKLEEKIIKYKKESKIEYFKENTKKRKERAYKLIKLGALFEITDLLEEPHQTLLAFLLQYKKLSDIEKEKLFSIGSKFLEDRKNNKKLNKKISSNSIRNVSLEEIISLIKIAKKSNIDIVKIMQNKFNKKLLENLNINEYKVLYELAAKVDKKNQF